MPDRAIDDAQEQKDPVAMASTPPPGWQPATHYPQQPAPKKTPRGGILLAVFAGITLCITGPVGIAALRGSTGSSASSDGQARPVLVLPTSSSPTATADPTVTAEPAASVTTVAPTTKAAPPAVKPTTAKPISAEEENAVRSAQSYLEFTAFSRKGLIKQLSSDAGEGYSLKAATRAVDSLHINFNEQAAKSAKSYLEFSAFSRKGLIKQLESDAGEGFTHSQAVYGVNKAGL
jgi:hypothetical protein